MNKQKKKNLKKIAAGAGTGGVGGGLVGTGGGIGWGLLKGGLGIAGAGTAKSLSPVLAGMVIGTTGGLLVGAGVVGSYIIYKKIKNQKKDS